MSAISQVNCDISVVLGATTTPIHQKLRLGDGAIIEFEANDDDEVTMLSNNTWVAKVVVSINGNRIGVAVPQLLPRQEAAAWF